MHSPLTTQPVTSHACARPCTLQVEGEQQEEEEEEEEEEGTGEGEDLDVVLVENEDSAAKQVCHANED